jgi:hypothetical protein
MVQLAKLLVNPDEGLRFLMPQGEGRFACTIDATL